MKSKNQIRKHLREFVALSLVPNLGAHRIRMLLQVVEHPRDIFRMRRSELENVTGIGQVISKEISRFNSWPEVDAILKRAEKEKARIVTFGDRCYPELLREIFDPPIFFWMKGDPEILNSDCIAVVGTRKASKYGLSMAEYFAGELVNAGITVVSGLANGIDAAAHRATVKAGGKTVAVLGSGIDNIYPEQNIRLAYDIMEKGGVVMTEFPMGANPDAVNFPVRNRIVSGMSLGTLVVESGLEGGSMITARSSLDQNREVFVVPHSVENKTGFGCNYLIKAGFGKLVQSIEDILDEIDVHRTTSTSTGPARESKWKSLELDETGVSICRLLEETPLHIDKLGEELNLPVYVLLPKLLELEMQECVRQNAGKVFELK